MLDLAVKSSSEGETNLMWEAWSDRIPPRDTEVLLELVPDFDEKPADKPAAKTNKPE